MNRPPLVLLHAFPLDATMFDAIRPLVPAIELITPNQRGFGGRPLGQDLPDLNRAAEDVIAELDERNVDQVVLGGVSMGGYVALALLSRFPGRIAGLVLADTRATSDGPEAAAGRLAKADDAESVGLPAAADLVAPLLGPSASPDARERAAAIVEHASPASFAWAQRAMAARGDTSHLLSAADLPVLIIVGADDRVTPPDEAAAMAQQAGRAILVELADAGHLTPLEAPAEFAQALNDWYDTVFPAGDPSD